MTAPTPLLARTLSVNDAAAYLGVHRDTVIRWADAGVLAYAKTPSGRRRFTQADLDAALQRQTPDAVPA